MSDENGIFSRLFLHGKEDETATAEEESMPENQLGLAIEKDEPELSVEEKETVLQRLANGMEATELAGVQISKDDMEIGAPSASPTTEEAILNKQRENDKFLTGQRDLSDRNHDN